MSGTCRYAARSQLVLVTRFNSIDGHLPRFLFRDPKICRLAGLLTETNVVIVTPNKLVPQRLQAGKKEGCGGRQVSNRQGEVRDRHVCVDSLGKSLCES